MDEREPEVTPVLRDDDEEASSFAPDLHPETLAFGVERPGPAVCQWCNTPLEDATVATCPHCGAALQPLEPDIEVPGLTTMSPEARAAQARVERKLREAMETRSLGRSLFIGSSAPAEPSPVIEELSADEGVLAGSYQPPPQAVQDLIRRMEMEARMARQEILPPLSEVELAAGAESEATVGSEALAASAESVEDDALEASAWASATMQPADETATTQPAEPARDQATEPATDQPATEPATEPATDQPATEPATEPRARAAKRSRKPRRGTTAPSD